MITLIERKSAIGIRIASSVAGAAILLFSPEAWVSKVYYKNLTIGQLSDHSAFIFQVERTRRAPVSVTVRSKEGKESKLRYFEFKVLKVLKTSVASGDSGYTFVKKPSVELPDWSNGNSPKIGSIIFAVDLAPLQSEIPEGESYSIAVLPFAAKSDQGTNLFFAGYHYVNLKAFSGVIGLGLVGTSALPSQNAHLKITEIFDAMRSGKIENLKKAIADNKDVINAVNEVWGAPIHFAARYGKKEDVELLLENGASLETMDAKGNPVLHNLVDSGFMDNAEWLVQHTKDLGAKNKAGQTALDIAKAKNNTKFIQLLEKK
jgi:hypothetical protein